MFTYILIIVTNLSTAYGMQSTVTLHDFQNELECKSVAHYIGATARGNVTAYCQFMAADKSVYDKKKPVTIVK